jgi:hypothetical protein
MLLSVWFSNKAANIQKQAQENPAVPRIVVNDRPVFPVGEASQPSPMAQTTSAITIIGTLPQEKPSPARETVKKKPRQVIEELFSSMASQEVWVEQKDVVSGQAEAGSGITVINKRPSEEETKEMNQRGIVMY